MKRIIYATFLVALVVCRTGSAEESVPHRIFYQSLLEDNDGNLMTDPFVEMEFRILNEENQPVYSEQLKEVQVIDNTVSVPVGDSGGITAELLDPRTGPKFLDVSVNQGKATDSMELGSVPYSIWSEKSLGVVENSIGSEEIKNRSIKLEDLAEEITFGDISGQIDLSTQVSSTVATDEELGAHIQATAAHPATAVTVQGPFMQSVGSNVETVLRDLDQKLSLEMGNRQANNSGETTARIAADQAEATARIATDEAHATAVANEATSRSSEDQRILESEISRGGDSIYGDLVFYQDSSLSNETLRISPPTGNIVSDGSLSLLGGLMSVAQDPDSSGAIVSLHDRQGAERLMFDGETGSMTVDGNISITGMVDGVDVSSLNSNVTSHTSTTSAHGSDGAIVGVNTLNGSVNNLQSQINGATTNISNLQSAFEGHRNSSYAHGSNGAVVGINTLNSTADGLQGQINTANNAISSLQSVVSGINNLPGTLSESKIDNSITRDGEVVGIAEGSFVNQGGDSMSGPLAVPSLSVSGDIGMGGWLSGTHIQMVTTGQIAMPRGDDNYAVTSDLLPPSDDYIVCGAWGVLDAMTINGDGGEFSDDDHWGPGRGSNIQGSAVTWQIEGSNSPGASKAVRIICYTSGNDAHYACRGFALFSRGIPCSMPGL